MMTFIVGLCLLALAGVGYQQSLAASGRLGGAAPQAAAAPASNVKYACPMRCVETDEPGSCPVCGMDMQPIEKAVAGQAGTAGTGSDSGPTMYTCPMHPQIVQDHPGSCPICGMELVPRTGSNELLDESLTEAVQAVSLSPSQEVLANVTQVHTSRERMALTVPAIGEVTIPQDQMKDIVAWQMGRVDNLLLDKTGGRVEEGQHILDIYSPDLVAAQQEYLLALRGVDELGDSSYPSIAQSARAMLDAARQKLTRMGLSAEQIATLDKTRQVAEHVAISATSGGVVMEKNVSEGMYVDQGMKLFSVANLDQVWVEVQVFEKDAGQIKVGDRVTLRSAASPGTVFKGRIKLIEPELNMETRTWRVRVGVENPKMLLRPGMILDAELAVDYGELTLLPRNAVLHTGDGDLVYVASGAGEYTPRRVTVGRDFGDKVEIVAGLRPEEAVAGTAAFLLDSEAQLKGIPRPVDTAPPSPPASDTGAEHQHGQ